MSTRAKRKILLWYWGRRGGGAQFTLGLARALLPRTDVDLHVSLSEQNEILPAFKELDTSLHLVRTYTNRTEFLTSSPRLPALRQRFGQLARGQDAVISTMAHLWTPIMVPAISRQGVPYFPVIHDAVPHPGDVSIAWDWRLGRELSHARAAIVLSRIVADRIAERSPDLPLIRMRLRAVLEDKAVRPKESAASDEIRLLFFGRFRDYKGLDLLRDAFSLVQASHPGIRLRVVGEGDASACAPGIEALAGVTVEPRWVPEGEIASLLAGSDAVILPYREASQSGIVPQALALGVPVVATPVGGLVEQVREGAGGLLAAAPTAPALAAAIARLSDGGTLAALRNEALAAARRSSDWDAAADELMTGLSRFIP